MRAAIIIFDEFKHIERVSDCRVSCAWLKAGASVFSIHNNSTFLEAIQ